MFVQEGASSAPAHGGEVGGDHSGGGVEVGRLQAALERAEAEHQAQCCQIVIISHRCHFNNFTATYWSKQGFLSDKY